MFFFQSLQMRSGERSIRKIREEGREREATSITPCPRSGCRVQEAEGLCMSLGSHRSRMLSYATNTQLYNNVLMHPCSGRWLVDVFPTACTPSRARGSAGLRRRGVHAGDFPGRWPALLSGARGRAIEFSTAGGAAADDAIARMCTAFENV